MILALGMSYLLIVTGIILPSPLGGLLIGILSYFILRYFRIRKIEYLLVFAAMLMIMFTSMAAAAPDAPALPDVILDVFMVLVLPFLLISMIVWYMRRSIEKVRKRLEAEGRIYPPGYGRCKRCGTVALPGEVCCRRCGEYIDVPEELRVKKVNYFECSECGREVPEDAGVCPFCGEAFDDED